MNMDYVWMTIIIICGFVILVGIDRGTSWVIKKIFKTPTTG